MVTLSVTLQSNVLPADVSLFSLFNVDTSPSHMSLFCHLILTNNSYGFIPSFIFGIPEKRPTTLLNYI